MMSRDVPPLPPDTGAAAWPALDANLADQREHIGVRDLDEQVEVATRNRQTTHRLQRQRRLVSAAPKGAVIGLCAFVLLYGLVPSVVAWWHEISITLPPLNNLQAWAALPPHLTPQASDWISAAPWLAVALGILVSLVLRMRVGIILAALVCIVLGAFAVPYHPVALGICVVVGIVLRCLYQLFPAHRKR